MTMKRLFPVILPMFLILLLSCKKSSNRKKKQWSLT